MRGFRERQQEYQLDQLVPSTFDGQTHVFGAPANWDREKDGECAVLGVQEWQHPETPGHKDYLSCWKLTLWQRLRVLLRGEVWLNIAGMQPPVSLHVNKPCGPLPSGWRYWL